MSEAERFQLDHKIKDSILVDFDENDSAIVLDRQGKRITNPSKVGSFMSIEEIIEDIATKENLIVKNNTAQTSATTIKTNTTTQVQTVGNKAIDPAVLAKRRAFGLQKDYNNLKNKVQIKTIQIKNSRSSIRPMKLNSDYLYFKF